VIVRRVLIGISLAAVLALVLLLVVSVARGPRAPAGESVRAALSVADALGGDTAGFARVTGPRPFVFPADHGAHPEYRTEWWYFTGNLETAGGDRIGYQLTLFRNAVTASEPQVASDWATRQVWMGHLGVTDVRRGQFHSAERFARGAVGLAGAEVEPLRVWLEDWRIEQLDEAGEDLFPLRLVATEGDVAIDLVVRALKPVVLQGEDGYSRKGRDPANASHYYSFTRLATEGSVRVGGEQVAVTGE
jgi:predicted secreted hydrolase